jgi:hypothetical protein
MHELIANWRMEVSLILLSPRLNMVMRKNRGHLFPFLVLRLPVFSRRFYPRAVFLLRAMVAAQSQIAATAAVTDKMIDDEISTDQDDGRIHDASMETDSGPKTCPHCQKEFSKSSKFTRHLRTHTGEVRHSRIHRISLRNSLFYFIFICSANLSVLFPSFFVFLLWVENLFNGFSLNVLFIFFVLDCDYSVLTVVHSRIAVASL